MFYFYTPWKRQQTKGFLAFSGGIEMEHWAKINLTCTEKLFCIRKLNKLQNIVQN